MDNSKIEVDCLVCIESPPNKANAILDGDIPVCQECFDCIAPQLTTKLLETLVSI